jgi:hypothetical protein
MERACSMYGEINMYKMLIGKPEGEETTKKTYI